MAPPGRWQAVFDLVAAHRDLTQLEWMELKRALAIAVVCSVFASVFAATGWLAANVAIVLLLRGDPLRAVLAVAGANVLAAALAGWQIRRALGRPFFAHTKREAAEDARVLLRALL